MRPGIDELSRLLQTFIREGQGASYFLWEQVIQLLVE